MPRVSLSDHICSNEIDSINKENYNIKINEGSKIHSGSATFGNRKDKFRNDRPRRYHRVAR